MSVCDKVLRNRLVRGMNGRLISVCCVLESSIFAFSEESFKSEGHAVVLQIDPVLLDSSMQS